MCNDNGHADMEPTDHAPNKPSSRNTRGSLEVFNPSTYATRPTNPAFRPNSTWQNWGEPRGNPELEEPAALSSKSGRANTEEITSWMALANSDSPVPQQPQSPLQMTISALINNDHDSHKSPAKGKVTGEVSAATQRAAEWGLVLKTDNETGKPQGVKVRTSGDDPNAKHGAARRDSGNSMRSSGEMSDDGAGEFKFQISSEREASLVLKYC